jgi:hypothetical protein
MLPSWTGPEEEGTPVSRLGWNLQLTWSAAFINRSESSITVEIPEVPSPLSFLHGAGLVLALGALRYQALHQSA